MPPLSAIPLPGFAPATILHEDSRFLAIDKPAGLPCAAPDAAPDAPSLERLLESAVAAHAPWAEERGIRSLRIVRPLDSEVGGVLLLARAPGSRLTFAHAIEERRARSEFLVVVGGKPPKRRWTSCLKLRPDPDHPDRMLTHTRLGQFAETDFEVLGHGDGMALLLARPFTHRPHQIRAHLAATALPILGDTLYGFGRRAPVKQPGILPRSEPATQRSSPLPLALRAARLAFECPFTREPVDIQAPLDAFLADYGFEVGSADSDDSDEP